MRRGEEIPGPPEDLGIPKETVEFVNKALTTGDMQVSMFFCESCGYFERRLESRTSGFPTVYCPNKIHATQADQRVAMRRSVAGW
jgi:hypothetical protein